MIEVRNIPTNEPPIGSIVTARHKVTRFRSIVIWNGGSQAPETVDPQGLEGVEAVTWRRFVTLRDIESIDIPPSTAAIDYNPYDPPSPEASFDLGEAAKAASETAPEEEATPAPKRRRRKTKVEPPVQEKLNPPEESHFNDEPTSKPEPEASSEVEIDEEF